jgi:hypothetical protein
MPNHQMLDNIAHKDLKIRTEHKPEYGDTGSYTNVVISEFRDVQAHYPIFFRKNTESGQFEAIAMFGFDSQENLFLDDDGWHAKYVPLTIQRRPFMIGFKNTNEGGVAGQEPVAFVDMDSPRISSAEDDGEQVFLPQGGQSEYLQRIGSVLQTVNVGHQETKIFIDALLENELIESVTIKVQLDNGTNHELAGLYTLNEEKVSQLNGETLQGLHANGYLFLMHMISASMSNMTDLIDKKNQTF